jgi:phage tail protein X
MMEARYIEYTTRQQDRLDLIAYKMYGDPTNWKPIIDANPQFGILDTYPAGTKIRVPVLTYVNDQVSRTNLPPWKRT